MKKGKKIDFKKVAINSVIAAGTGAVAQVVSEAVLVNNPEYVDYAMIGVGVILPEVMKGNEMVETASTALLAVGGYRMSERLDLSGKLGINTTTPPATTAGFGDRNAIGSGWNPTREVYSGKTKKNNKSNTESSVM